MPRPTHPPLGLRPAAQASRLVRARRQLLLAGSSALAAPLTLPLTLPLAAWAAPGGLPTNVQHGDSSPQWEALRQRLFGNQPIQTGEASLVQLIVPLRAAYGASVPVKVHSRLPQTAQRHVRRMTLLVDKNPSPVAATLNLSPALGQADIETRLRVDEYSHVRVVAELNTGELHTDSRYVKVSGGCSAPPNRERPDLLGRTQLRLPQGLLPGQPSPVELTVMHPNDSGFELNQVTVMFIPPHFVRHIVVKLDGQPVFEAETDFSISENPSWRFQLLTPAARGELTAEVEDSKEQRFQTRLDLGQVAADGDRT